MKNNWYSFMHFIENWIYPAYYLRNMLFHRYDLIKIKNMKPYEYAEPNYLMEKAVFGLVIDFVNNENTKYIIWYKDDDGEDIGHKYGENKNDLMLFPEYKGKYIMDIMKEIKDWYINIYPQKEKEYNYLLSFWSKYIFGEWKEDKNEKDLIKMIRDRSKCPKSIKDIKEDIDWNIIDKYVKNRGNLLRENYLYNICNKLETEIEMEKQKYLYLCITIRPYLWT